MVHIVEKLQEDHQAIAELFERIRQTYDGSAENRQSLYDLLGRFFAAQTAFEEDVFYPAVREGGEAVTDEVDMLIGEAVSERHEILEMLENINEPDQSDTELARATGPLEAAIRAHLERERLEIFPIAERVIGRAAGEEMSERHDAMARQHV